MSDFNTDMSTAYFSSNYLSEKLLKYSVKIMVDHDERKGAVASQILKSLHWSYDVYFKLIVIKHAEDTNICTAVQKFSVAEPTTII
jgi:hypothetical protein